ncbi:hypothetical protein [Longibacter salinarum]|uniref:hypothetical protein n=1 Tax=Longibacter salinarum TaxID=1850348 RepID=UPI0011804BBD|nr:hypothetical protein [Longibacter salinarum]
MITLVCLLLLWRLGTEWLEDFRRANQPEIESREVLDRRPDGERRRFVVSEQLPILVDSSRSKYIVEIAPKTLRTAEGAYYNGSKRQRTFSKMIVYPDYPESAADIILFENDAPIVNLVAFDASTQTATPVFEERVFISRYIAMKRPPDGVVLYAAAIFEDTNESGTLGPEDLTTIYEIDPVSAEKTVLADSLVRFSRFHVTRDTSNIFLATIARPDVDIIDGVQRRLRVLDRSTREVYPVLSSDKTKDLQNLLDAIDSNGELDLDE